MAVGQKWSHVGSDGGGEGRGWAKGGGRGMMQDHQGVGLAYLEEHFVGYCRAEVLLGLACDSDRVKTQSSAPTVNPTLHRLDFLEHRFPRQSLSPL
jgi:hypothetical protein